MPKSAKKGPVVYVLELVGDIVSTSGSVVLDTGEASLDKEKLAPFKEKREKELDEYLGDTSEEEDEPVCYHNTDLDERPRWVISEYPLV